MMDILGVPLGAILRICYQIVQNYGLAIILFTLVTKILLFPVSLWVHVNGIKMVRIQPAINLLKIRYFGDGDKIAEEQAALYKREKYSPFGGVVPIFVQLVLLIGLIQVIYNPLSYILQYPKELSQAVIATAQQIGGIDATSGSAELLALDYLQKAQDLSAFSMLPGMTQELLDAALHLNTQFIGFHLSGVPIQDGGVLFLIPLLAGLASVILSLSQNVMNPLQREQGKIGKLGSMAFSVGLSLILGFLIPAGVGFYWIWSNLMSIAQQFILNTVYKPAKHIHYAELEASKKELTEYQQVGEQGKEFRRLYGKREREDYKRFFSVVNKHLVFYSESSGFYKYFERTIQYLLKNTNLTIHYITSDPNDQIFALAKEQLRIKPYYIGEKRLITLFMKLEADVVVMTMSDLENYHYKRSYMKKDIEYVYMFHYPLSTHMVLHTGALDHYDTILCVGDFQFAEIRKQEELHNLPPKKLISCGYGQLEKLYDAYQQMPKVHREHPKVLIAPSWQEGNILDSCLTPMLNELLGKGMQIVVRPHPEYVKRYGSRMQEIVNRYQEYKGGDLEFELDFTSNTSIFDSDVVISDWSGTAYEFSFVTERPAVFVDTPPKINNPEYTKLGIEPLEFALRDQIGIRVDPKDMTGLAERVENLLDDESRRSAIAGIRSRYIANFGRSGEVSAQYLIETIQEKIRSRKNA